jgi:hypothetical protein
VRTRPSARLFYAHCQPGVINRLYFGVIRPGNWSLFFPFSFLDFMTDLISTLPAPDETTDSLRFLRRFADLMSTGSNSDNLLRAATTLEAQADLLKETSELLGVERIRGNANAGTRKTLEARIGELEREILALKSKLAEQQSHADQVVAEMERRQGEFLLRAEAAEARATAIEEVPPAIPLGSIPVPLSALKVAKAQFESLAAAFEKSGNIVSQVRCEASASHLDRVMADSGAAEDTEDRSQHAA